MSLGGVADLVFWGSAAVLGWAHGGYGAVIRRWPWSAAPIVAAPGPLPSVTVLLTVHNAAEVLAERLEDLLATDYPRDRLRIVVASDGSSDATVAIAEAFAGRGPITVLALPRGGKSATQTAAMATIDGDIVVMTDADAAFAPDCIRALVAPFADPTVGCTTAELLMRDGPGAIAGAQGAYWRAELRLRQAESRLGILAVTSGPAMAVRRGLFRPLPEDVGEDCIVPLDVVRQGYRVVHVATAIAHDQMNHDAGRELRARIRMTARNWIGTWRHPALLAPWRHPGYALALWSHKLLRWLGSLALAAMLLVGAGALVGGAGLTVPALFLVAVAGLGVVGAIGDARGRRVPVAASVYGFLLANLGFALGLLRAWSGRRIVTYRPARLDLPGQGGEP